MTPANAPTVFLSYDAAGREDARYVADFLGRAGVRVLDSRDVPAVANSTSGDATRAAVRASDAFVMILSSERPSAYLLFEMGLAFGANKPIEFVLADGVHRVDVPATFAKYRVVPRERVDEIALDLVGRPAAA